MSPRALLRPLVALVLTLTALGAAAAPAAADPVTVSGTVTLAPGSTTTLLYVLVYDVQENQQVSYAQASEQTGEYTLQIEPGTYTFSVFSQGSQTENGHYARNSTTTYTRNVVVDGDTTVNLAPVPTVLAEVNLVDTSGNDVPTNRSLTCRRGPEDTDRQHDDQRTSSGGSDPAEHMLAVIPIDTSANDGSGCQLVLQPTEPPFDGVTIVRDNLTFTDQPNQVLNIVMPDLVTVSGKVTAQTDEPMYGGEPAIDAISTTADGSFRNEAHGDADGNWSVDMPVGPAEFLLGGGSYYNNMGQWRQVTIPPEGLQLDTTVEYVPYTVHVVGGDGQPAEGYLVMRCDQPFDGLKTSQIHSTAYGTGALLFYGSIQPGWTCKIEDQTIYPYPAWTPDLGTEGGEATYIATTHEVVEGAPGASNDDDGVADVVEALGPNGGDGNDDGTPDNEQAHVTSLPAKGGAPGEDAPYLTLAGPSGSKLVDVTTSDVADAVTPPPAGTTLPAGLSSFTLDDITPGSTQTVSVYAGDTTGINGYAKYDPDTGVWSSLPAGRVQVFADHVDITLTDGGIGDDDGAANGSITDPGGMAVLPAVAGDTTPPVVTGTATTRPNAAGWYRSNVRIDWSATDPGSGVQTQPPDTIVSTEGANVSATSPLVCDKAPTPNCGRGSVAGLKIDKTAPSLAVTGVSNGATYVVGAVPTPGCTASDALSGLARPCAGVRAGGNSAGVGAFTYATTANDKAGNSRVATAGYRVTYRFDGFAQPLNDPASPLSVFRAGSTVPVAFTLKRANGTTVAPVGRPTWVSPVRGARTSAPVNEPVSTAKGTSGTSFVLRNGRWTFDWSTRGVPAGYVYRIGVRLDDGTTHYVSVGLR